MNLLLAEIEADINWRLTEISIIKTIPHRYSLNEDHKKVLIKYAIPSLYAIWEGYVKNTFDLLTTFINKLNIDPKLVNINLLTHAIENECNLGNERKHFEKKIKLVESALNIINSQLNVKPEIPTESNIDFKVMNKIFERFNIKSLDNKYQKPLNRLILHRNKIAHGDNSIIVSKDEVDEFSLLIEDIMYELLIEIETYIINEKYKKLII